MNSKNILSVLILFSLSCSKPSTPAPTTISNQGTLVIDGRSYNIAGTDRMSTNDFDKLSAFHSTAIFTSTYYGVDSATYKTSETINGIESTYFDYYTNGSLSKVESNNSDISTTKTTTGFMVNGSIYLYNNADSTKKILVKTSFSTL